MAIEKVQYNQFEKRQSCPVCHRQSKSPAGLPHFTCFSCGGSYTVNGHFEFSHQVSKKKLYDEFSLKGITLHDKEVDIVFAKIYRMANRRDIKIRVTFASLLCALIDEYIKKGWLGKNRKKPSGLVGANGMAI